jgi:hypothetical protein
MSVSVAVPAGRSAFRCRRWRMNTSLKSKDLTDGSITLDHSKRARKLKLGLSGFQLTMRDGPAPFRMSITTSPNSNEMIANIHAKKRERLLCRNRMNPSRVF